MSLTIPLTPAMQADGARAVMTALEARGGKGCVRFVGGCVRNALMGRPESDLDLSTQLVPDETEAALKAAGIRSVPTGKVFGTITAIVDGVPYEITSLREDVETDGRRAVVSFTDDWARDALRRDFYLNALYADAEGAVYDPTGQGIADATAGRVRFIGDAGQRIREDYLRILRFFRFTAGYAREVDAASLSACVRHRNGIDTLSAERIWDEVRKMLKLSDPQRAFEPIQAGGLMPHIVSGWKALGHSLPELTRMAELTPDTERRLMALLDSGLELSGPNLKNIQKRMRFSEAVAARLLDAAEALKHMEAEDDLRKVMYRHGRTAVEDAVFLAASHGAQSPDRLLEHLAQTDIPVFPLKGADLIARGMAAGPEVGARLKAIETEWIAQNFSSVTIETALDQTGQSPPFLH